MQLRRFAGVMLASLWIAAGCGCPCPAPETPTQPTSTAKKPRPVLPKLPPMGQCVDTPEDVGLEMEREGDLGIVSLSADAFIDLAPEQRILAYHLSRAAVAGEPLVYRQRSALGAELKSVAEALALHRADMPDALRPQIETFVRRVFVHKGIHDSWTGRKMPPPFNASEFRRALAIASGQGAELPFGQGEQAVAQTVAKLGPLLFDPEFDPRPPDHGQGSLKDAHAQLAPVIASLEQAATVAESSQKRSLRQLASYLSTGSAGSYQTFMRTAAQQGPVSARMGLFASPAFGEQFWASVQLEDDSMQPLLEEVAAALPRMRKEVLGDANAEGYAAPRAALPLTLTGWASPVTPSSIWLEGPELPAQAWVWSGVLDAEVKLRSLAVKKGFVPDPARKADFERCLPHAYKTRAILRAVMDRAAPAAASAMARADGAVIERARAEAAALVASWDSAVVDAGLLPEPVCSDMLDALVPADFLVRLGSVAQGSELHAYDLRAMSLIVRHAVAAGALREVTRDGHVHLQVADRDAWRAAIRSLLGTLLRIEADGNAAKARELLRAHANDPVSGWRQSARDRVKKAGLPARLVFVAPRVKSIRDADGTISDATIVDFLGIIETALIDAGKMEMP